MDLQHFLEKPTEEKHYLPEEVFDTEETASFRTPGYIFMGHWAASAPEELPLCVGQESRKLHGVISKEI